MFCPKLDYYPVSKNSCNPHALEQNIPLFPAFVQYHSFSLVLAEFRAKWTIWDIIRMWFDFSLVMCTVLVRFVSLWCHCYGCKTNVQQLGVFSALILTVCACLELGAMWEGHRCISGEAEGLQKKAVRASAWSPRGATLWANQMQGDTHTLLNILHHRLMFYLKRWYLDPSSSLCLHVHSPTVSDTSSRCLFNLSVGINRQTDQQQKKKEKKTTSGLCQAAVSLRDLVCW